MTNREKIASMIEPYALSDDAYEGSFLDAAEHFGTSGEIDGSYTSSLRQTVTLAAMYCLRQLITLSSENIGGVSQSYDENDLKKAIKGLASSAGLSASLVLDDDSDDYNISSPKVW